MCDLTRYLLVKERLHTLQVKGRGGSGPTEVSLCRSEVKLSAWAGNWSDKSLTDEDQGESEGGRNRFWHRRDREHSANTGKANCGEDTSAYCITHAQYFALINSNKKLKFCVNVSFSLLLVLLDIVTTV